MLRRLPRRVLRLSAWRNLSRMAGVAQRIELASPIAVEASQMQQGNEVRRRPFPGDIGLGEADIPAECQARRQRQLWIVSRARGPGSTAVEHEPLPAGVSARSSPVSRCCPTSERKTRRRSRSRCERRRPNRLGECVLRCSVDMGFNPTRCRCRRRSWSRAQAVLDGCAGQSLRPQPSASQWMAPSP